MAAELSLGWLPDPDKVAGDPPDWRFAELATELGLGDKVPSRVSLRHLLAPPLDQGELGSCVAQAVAQLVHASHKRQDVASPRLLSRLALYYLARASHHTESWDSGTHLRTAFTILNRFGYCPESIWPYAIPEYRREPPPAVFMGSFDQASSQAPTSYWRIDGTPSQCEQQILEAVAAGYPVAFGIDVTVEFASSGFAPTEPVGSPGADDPIAGGHAMVIGGYSITPSGVVFDVLSSWGQDWGDEGWCQCHAEWICYRGRDMWVGEHCPPYTV